ncbi:MAG: hypothetical protein ACI8RZ_001510 [Myxococcota bacterium]|jgi:hypothetical protein
MMGSLLIASALAGDPCAERLQSLQIAAHGSVAAVVQLGDTATALNLQILEPSRGHGVRATSHRDLQAFAGHHDDGTAWLKVFRDGAPVAALNEHLLAAGWSGGDADLLIGVEPILIALIFAAVEPVGGAAEVLGVAVLDWMYAECSR